MKRNSSKIEKVSLESFHASLIQKEAWHKALEFAQASVKKVVLMLSTVVTLVVVLLAICVWFFLSRYLDDPNGTSGFNRSLIREYALKRASEHDKRPNLSLSTESSS